MENVKSSLWRRFHEFLHSVVCNHEWIDEWAFANCITVTIPSGDRRPVSWQVMQSCEHCYALRRRRITADEWAAWKAALLDEFKEGGDHLYMDELPAPKDTP